MSETDRKSVDEFPSPPIHGQLLSKALARFRSELNDSDDDESLLGVVSVEDLISQTKALQPAAARNGQSLTRLEPILTHVNDFAPVIAFCNGANPKTTRLV
ncbi:MAG: hypothetical protein MMC23_001781 [Stictis urceolatum]|nr:hypothetical protein [Stictis urceolata]